MGSLMWAKEDNIRIDGRGVYYPPCTICGEEVRSTVYSRKMTFICKDCKSIIKKIKTEKADRKHEVSKANSEKRFDDAVKKLKKQGIDGSWDNAIRIAKTKSECYGSVPEAMMAIGLLRTKHKIVPQPKIGSLHPDFALPEQKRIVEVDGSIYHLRYSKEEERDLRLRMMLGSGWDVVHVPAEMVEENILYSISFFVDKQKQKQP